MRVRLEQPPVRVPPDPRPSDWQSLFTQQSLDHGDVDIIEVDFVLSDATFVGTPVRPEMLDDAGGEGVSGMEERGWGWMLDGSVGEGDGARF